MKIHMRTAAVVCNDRLCVLSSLNEDNTNSLSFKENETDTCVIFVKRINSVNRRLIQAKA